MRKEVCVNCSRVMAIALVGAKAIEYRDAEHSEPYKIWNCDISACRNCENTVVARWADKPFLMDFEEGFNAEIQSLEEAAKSGERTVIRFF